MSSNITRLRYEEKNIGSTFSSSKKHFIWEFDLDGKPQRIELYDSRWSGKKKIIKNGIVECEEIDQGNFFKNFSLNEHNVVIIQYGDKNELRIDGQCFTHLYNLEKNKNFFAVNNQPTSNYYVSNPKAVDSNVVANNFYKNEDKPKGKKIANFKIEEADNKNAKKKGGFGKFRFGNAGNDGEKKNENENKANNNLLNVDNNNLLAFDNTNNNNLFSDFGNENVLQPNNIKTNNNILDNDILQNTNNVNEQTNRNNDLLLDIFTNVNNTNNITSNSQQINILNFGNNQETITNPSQNLTNVESVNENNILDDVFNSPTNTNNNNDNNILDFNFIETNKEEKKEEEKQPQEQENINLQAENKELFNIF